MVIAETQETSSTAQAYLKPLLVIFADMPVGQVSHLVQPNSDGLRKYLLPLVGSEGSASL